MGLRASCDTTATETNVHFPTDINLLLDATRRTETLEDESPLPVPSQHLPHPPPDMVDTDIGFAFPI